MSRSMTVAFRAAGGEDDCVRAWPGSRFEGPAAPDNGPRSGDRNAGALSSILGEKRSSGHALFPHHPPHLAAYSAVPIDNNVRPIATTGTEAPKGAFLP